MSEFVHSPGVQELERLLEEIITKYGSFDNAIRAGNAAWWDTPEGKAAMAKIDGDFWQAYIESLDRS